jgi:hypothetical protein
MSDLCSGNKIHFLLAGQDSIPAFPSGEDHLDRSNARHALDRAEPLVTGTGGILQLEACFQ